MKKSFKNAIHRKNRRVTISAILIMLLIFIPAGCEMDRMDSDTDMPLVPLEPSIPNLTEVTFTHDGPLGYLYWQCEKADDLIDHGKEKTVGLPRGSKITVWVDSYPMADDENRGHGFAYSSCAIEVDGEEYELVPMTVQHYDDEGNPRYEEEVYGVTLNVADWTMSVGTALSYDFSFTFDKSLMGDGHSVTLSYMKKGAAEPYSQMIEDDVSVIHVSDAVADIVLEPASTPSAGSEFTIMDQRFLGHDIEASRSHILWNGPYTFMLKYFTDQTSDKNIITAAESLIRGFMFIPPEGFEVKINGELWTGTDKSWISVPYGEDLDFLIIDSLNAIKNVTWRNGEEPSGLSHKLSYDEIKGGESVEINPVVALNSWTLSVHEPSMGEYVTIRTFDEKRLSLPLSGVNDGKTTTYTLPALTMVEATADTDRSGYMFSGWEHSKSQDSVRRFRIVSSLTEVVPLYFQSAITDGAVYVLSEESSNIAPDAVKGSEANPYHSIEEAVRFAEENESINEVRLYEGAFRINDPLYISTDLTISGGWRRGRGQYEPSYSGSGAPENVNSLIIMMKTAVEDNPKGLNLYEGGLRAAAPALTDEPDDKAKNIFAVEGSLPITFILDGVSVGYEKGHYAMNSMVIDDNNGSSDSKIIIRDSQLVTGQAKVVAIAVSSYHDTVIERSTITSLGGMNSFGINIQGNLSVKDSKIYANNRNPEAMSTMGIYHYPAYNSVDTIKMSDTDVYAFAMTGDASGLSFSGKADIADTRFDIFQPGGEGLNEGKHVDGMHAEADSDIFITDSEIYVETSQLALLSGIRTDDSTRLMSVNNLVFTSHAETGSCCVDTGATNDIILFGNVFASGNMDKGKAIGLRTYDSDVLALNNDFLGCWGDAEEKSGALIELHDSRASIINSIFMNNSANTEAVLMDQSTMVLFGGNAFAGFHDALLKRRDSYGNELKAVELNELKTVLSEAKSVKANIMDGEEEWTMDMFASSDPYNPNFEPVDAPEAIQNGGLYADPQNLSRIIEHMRVTFPAIEKDYIHVLYEDMRGKHRRTDRCTIGACQYL